MVQNNHRWDLDLIYFMVQRALWKIKIWIACEKYEQSIFNFFAVLWISVLRKLYSMQWNKINWITKLPRLNIYNSPCKSPSFQPTSLLEHFCLEKWFTLLHPFYFQLWYCKSVCWMIQHLPKAQFSRQSYRLCMRFSRGASFYFQPFLFKFLN
jgi:hypothetical protein